MMRVLISVAVCSVFSCLAFGQTEKPLTFELADVHSSPPSTLASLSGGVPRSGRYELRNANMVDLIRTAYGVEPEKVVGGPNWMTSDRFDVIAKVPAGITEENARLMLRTLLADRFGLTVHNDSKPLTLRSGRAPTSIILPSILAACRSPLLCQGGVLLPPSGVATLLRRYAG